MRGPYVKFKNFKLSLGKLNNPGKIPGIVALWHGESMNSIFTQLAVSEISKTLVRTPSHLTVWPATTGVALAQGPFLVPQARISNGPVGTVSCLPKAVGGGSEG